MSEPARNQLTAQPVGEVVQVGGSALIDVISRAASDPNTDVEKLERLLGMYERITAHSAEEAFDNAMNAAQEEMRPIAADANNPQTRSRYASYAALDRAIRPIYTKHGFSLAFDTADGAPPEHVRVVCRVKRAGHKEEHHIDMPADGKGAKGGDVMTKTHATGAAITYGKRYLLGMVFNIAVGEDNDGNRMKPGRNPSAAAAMCEEIAGCNTVSGLRSWKEANEAKINALTSDDATAVARAFNARLREIRGPAQ